MRLSVEDMDHLQVFLLVVAPLKVSSCCEAIKDSLIWTVTFLVSFNVIQEKLYLLHICAERTIHRELLNKLFIVMISIDNDGYLLVKVFLD